MLNIGKGPDYIVLAFKGRRDYDGKEWHGTVLVQTPREYVTWRVSSFDGGATFDCYSGNYPTPQVISPDAYVAALDDFNRR